MNILLSLRCNWMLCSLLLLPHLSSFFLLFVISLQNHVNPAMDFTQTPPGMLALDNMLYLAKLHQDTYIRVRPSARPKAYEQHIIEVCINISSIASPCPLHLIVFLELSTKVKRIA